MLFMFKKLAVTIISLTILITCIYPINALEINADLTIDTEVVDDAVIEEEKIICSATIVQR